jgi:hypothetical protein
LQAVGSLCGPSLGSRYLFIVLYCLIETWLSRGDYNPNTRTSHQTPVVPKQVHTA